MNFKNTFPKEMRLKNSHVIRDLFKSGEYFSLGSLGIKFRKSEHYVSLFAISVSKKVGNSPYRNRIKRLLREAVRVEKSNLISKYEICFFVIDSPTEKIEYIHILDKIKHFFDFLNKES